MSKQAFQNRARLIETSLLTLSTSYHRLLTEDLVTVEVGPNDTMFDVHEKLLCASSKYLESEIRDNNTRNLWYPELDPNIFRLVVHWLYGTKTTLDIPSSNGSDNDSNTGAVDT